MKHGAGDEGGSPRGVNEKDNTKSRANPTASQDSNWVLPNTNVQCYGCTDIYISIHLFCVTYEYAHIQST